MKCLQIFVGIVELEHAEYTSVKWMKFTNEIGRPMEDKDVGVALLLLLSPVVGSASDSRRFQLVTALKKGAKLAQKNPVFKLGYRTSYAMVPKHLCSK